VIAVLSRWWRRKRAYLLAWAVGLSMFGIGSFAEAFSAVVWNGPIFRSWYLFGAMLNAAWIGQGTVYLLAKPRAAHLITVVVVLLSLVGTYGLVTLSLNAEAFSADVSLAEQYKEIMPKGAWVRAMTPLFNIYGLIALGALVIALVGTLTRLGIGDFLYVGELVAASLMFTGFRFANRPAPAVDSQLSSI
jgi:hypothetical protein